MKRFVLKLAACTTSCLLASCAPILYSKTPTGKFEGKLIVEWVAPNQFIYRPDKDKPLSYTTASGRRIVPELMYTDGGSIPRLFWSARGFGPWDFAPGYIVHDWLFHQHHCQIGDWQYVDFSMSAAILAEALKTQMEKSEYREPTIIYAVYEAVKSPVALSLWDKGECNLPAAAPPMPGEIPLRLLTIEFK